MSVRTFWIILLKILGLFIFMNGLLLLPYVISMLGFYDVGLFIIILLITIAVYFLVLWVVVFKTAWLVDVLKLEKGFTEDRIDIKMSWPKILTIAVIVIGGLIFVNAFPELCRQIFYFVQCKTVFMESPEISNIVLYGIETIIAYLLITNSKFIVSVISKQIPDNEP